MSETDNDGLIQLLDNVYLGGIIEDCVVEVADGIAKCMATDRSQSIFVQTTAATTLDDCTLGLQGVEMLSKYLKTYRNREMAIVKKDNILSVKPAGGTQLNFLLSEPDLISTYNADFKDIPDKIATIDLVGDLTLTTEKVSEFLTMMGLFKPKNVELLINKNGKVALHGGNVTTHQFDGTLGVCKDFEPVNVSFYGPYVTAVLSVIDFSTPATMSLVEGENFMVVRNGLSGWVIQTVS